ncbi:Complement C1q tumor necrosis factor-related protein 6 [Labeo rohita]|uniref:Complement C1q tumor necrosis factor-related protein 6 n=1 Tax=Labeo rohita TaxID=84645 RepID=A0ABQ8L4C4_LABRO|nr:Complement C1q tumor necrosis factor-related protein 6 [Labeo rohita]
MQSNSGYVGPFTTDITLTYRNVFTNIGNAYNQITGVFTAPLKGAYRFRVSVYGHGNPSNPAYVSIMKNGEKVVMAYARQDQRNINSSNGVVLILEVGDVVYVRLWSGSSEFTDNPARVIGLFRRRMKIKAPVWVGSPSKLSVW